MSAMTPTDAVNVLKFLERTRVKENNPDGAAMLQRVEAHLSAWVSQAASEPINDGGPVHPCRIPTGGLHKCDEPPTTRIHFGKSLRDDFAGLAMQGFLSGHISYHGHGIQPGAALPGSEPAGGVTTYTDGQPDPLLDQARSIVVADGKASISYLQRKLQIGYNRAARLLEDLEALGVVSHMNAAGLRDVLAKS